MQPLAPGIEIKLSELTLGIDSSIDDCAAQLQPYASLIRGLRANGTKTYISHQLSIARSTVYKILEEQNRVVTSIY